MARTSGKNKGVSGGAHKLVHSQLSSFAVAGGIMVKKA